MNIVDMKNIGGQRTTPAEQAEERKRITVLRPLFPCHLCEFGSDCQSVWDKHLKEKHRNGLSLTSDARTCAKYTGVKGGSMSDGFMGELHFSQRVYILCAHFVHLTRNANIKRILCFLSP